jgi:pyruvate dehydrogenase E2 component (dihydrolipoamide acetyltransferase)
MQGGPRKVILKEDVRKAATALAPQVASTSDAFELVQFTPMRRAIAANLSRSKQTIPHFYLTIDLQMDRLLALRQEMNSQRDDARKLSINDFLLRATALALHAVPAANVHYTDEGLRKFKAVHLCVAVAIEGGLVTPVLRDAQEKGVCSLSEEVGALAECARARTLKPEQFTGGTFTVSNLGMYGIRQFDAVINPPQGGILAVGQARREAFEEEGGLAFRSVMSVTLSCDHRAIDGAVGAQFLNELKKKVERPLSMLS